MEPNELTNNDGQTEQVAEQVQENTNVVNQETSNESTLEAPLTDVNGVDDKTIPEDKKDLIEDNVDTSNEIKQKLEKLKEYEVKEQELNELRNRLGGNQPKDNVIFNAQRELAIVENQAQQDYIRLCNEYGVDYRPDKIDKSALELQEKDPKAFYDLKYRLNELNNQVELKREQVNTFIANRDLSMAYERNRQAIQTSPAIQQVLNMYSQSAQLTGDDIDSIVNSSLLIAKEAYEMGRQAAMQAKQNVNPSQILNNNIIAQHTSTPTDNPTTLTLDDVAKMDIQTYAKNEALIDRLFAEGKLK